MIIIQTPSLQRAIMSGIIVIPGNYYNNNFPGARAAGSPIFIRNRLTLAVHPCPAFNSPKQVVLILAGEVVLRYLSCIPIV